MRFFRYALTLTLLLAGTLAFATSAEAKVVSTPLAVKTNRMITHELDSPASGIAAEFSSKGSRIEFQTKENGQWSEWKKFVIDNDAKPGEKHSQLVFTDNATAVRLKSPESTSLTLHAIAVDQSPLQSEVASASRRLPAPVIVPRWQWKPNEHLRVSRDGAKNIHRAFYSSEELVRNCNRRAYLYPEEFRETRRKFTEDVDSNGTEDRLVWPIGYSQDVNLIIVHHTAESSDATRSRSDAERRRTIYEYHTVGRGWGDIGYNFVVGENGTIFEGRAGGDYAVGAHASCNNVGSVGIAVLGNMQEGRLSDAQGTALKWLLVHLTDKYDINPDGEVVFHGKRVPTIIGHRDVGQTACPGAHSYELLPQLRVITKNREYAAPLFSSAAAPSSQHEAALMASLDPVSVTMGEMGQMTARFMNVGLDIWAENTWLLAQGDDGLHFTTFRPSSFIAARMQEQSVGPGEVATFVVDLQGGLSTTEGWLTLTPIINNERRLVKNTAPLKFKTDHGSPRYTYVTSSFPPLHKTGEDLVGTVKLVNAGTVPWDRDSITELEFELEGGTGDVSVLSHSQSIPPGRQGTFRLSIQNIEEEGRYQRSLKPYFSEGSSLVGESILVASRAEPVPDIAYTSTHSGLNTEIDPFADSSVHQSAHIAFLPDSKADRLSQDGDKAIEALAGINLTLSPREQATIPIRIRAGKHGIGKFEPIAKVTRSNPTIIIRDENNRRVTTSLRTPLPLRPYQTYDAGLTIIAPRREGLHTFSIGGINFQLTVRPYARYTIQKAPPRNISRRTTMENIRAQRRDRRLRRVRLAPAKTVKKPDTQYIRIRLSGIDNNAIFTSPSQMRIEGGGNIIFSNGPIHLNIQRDQCSVSTANGGFLSSAIRITPTDTNGYTTIMSLSRSANRFRGTIECRYIDGKLTLVNDLPLEEYLAGLAEEPDSEPYEKQRAFAIAARSYALHYVISDQRKFPGKPYDGSDSPAEFQAYGGLHFEEKNPRWVDAVKSTANQVLSYERKVVKAPYFSTDDGRTKSAYEVWGWTHTPYLDSKPDPWCIGMNNWGHGVGMSGCGSEGQANEGKTAEEILDYYYPGTRILPITSLE